MENDHPPFISFNNFLKKKFGCRVYKVSIDGKFSCPNRDGTKSKKGCIFCDEKGSSSRTNEDNISIKEQVLNNIKIRQSRYRAKKFIAYFQSFTNTYASTHELKKKYDEAITSHKDIVGLSVSTRPDCIDESKIKLLAEYKKKLDFVCIEYGMQTCHEKTLSIINRKETHQDFLQALAITKKYNLHHCIHVILGLPGESYQDMMTTAQTLKKLKVDGVKIHILVAMKDTFLEKMYNEKKWSPLSLEEYITLASDFINNLHKDCIIHRVSASGHPLHVIAPKWVIDKKLDLTSMVKNKLKEK